MPEHRAAETLFISENQNQPKLILRQEEISTGNRKFQWSVAVIKKNILLSANLEFGIRLYITNATTMKTMKLLTLLLFCAAVFQTTSSQAVQSDRDRQKRQISGFHGVSVSSGIDLFLSQKNVEEVFVEAGPDDLDKIITEVEGGVLKIYIREKHWFNLNWNQEPRKVYVSFTTLDKLEASAGSDVNSENYLKLDKLNLDASSGSDVQLELDINELSVGSSSGSDISLKGKATEMQADASSGSDINAGDFQVKKCAASASSGSDIKVSVTEELNANASSGGEITYSGNPAKKDINESSGGDVHGK
jgi:hypothetical protein